jgi:hypothetical protein
VLFTEENAGVPEEEAQRVLLNAPVGEDGEVDDVIELRLLVDGERAGGGGVGVNLSHLVPVLINTTVF